jgi:hypothetical protein
MSVGAEPLFVVCFQQRPQGFLYELVAPGWDARLLTRTGGQPVRVETIQADLAAGAPATLLCTTSVVLDKGTKCRKTAVFPTPFQ